MRVDSTAKLAEIESAEKEKMKAKVAKIVGHGISCFINRQLIFNDPEQVSLVTLFLPFPNQSLCHHMIALC